MAELGGYASDRLTEALDGIASQNRESSRTTARVLGRSADGTVWVQFAGSDQRTPLTGFTADVAKGDIVSVTRSGLEAIADGNYTDPPASGTRYEVVRRQAESAVQEAKRARDSADSAERDARRAADAADAAEADAGRAADAADAAEISAGNAEDSASAAATSAYNAEQSASSASGSAASAALSAGSAATSASSAQRSAVTASRYATNALASLSTVQSVAETLAWVTEHGTMTLTSDTAIDPTHVYFTVDQDGDYSVGGVHYSVVSDPVATGLPTYYVLSIDESLENYTLTHLALTDEGLWMLPTSGGYKVLAATGSGTAYTTAGTYIIDGSGGTVAAFTGNGVSFDSGRQFYIGDSSAFIHFDGNGHISIGGTGVTIGGSTTLAQLISKYDSTITDVYFEYAHNQDPATAPTNPSDWSTTPPSYQAGWYVWQRSVTVTESGPDPGNAVMISGKDGADGTSVTILGTYQSLADLQAAHPTGNLGDGYIIGGDLYVWDGNAWTDVGTIQGPQGATGPQGPQGTQGPAGTSVSIQSIQYGTSASASTEPSSWSSTAPSSLTKGTWLWVKTTYSNNSTAITKSYIGTDGSDGSSVYVASSTKSGGVTTVVITDGTTPTTLTIVDGQDGDDGIDGDDSYVHFAWANSSDGQTDFSTSVSANKLYIGVYSDTTQADSQDPSDYSWTLTKGETGATGATGATGPQGATGPEGVVTVYPTAINWTAGTATLAATLRVNGTVTTPLTRTWTKNQSTTALTPNQDGTLTVTDLTAVYNCTVTW